MASHSYGPTATAGMRPNLRESVNVERGRPSEGKLIGEGWERRTLFCRIKIWRAQRKLAGLLAKRRQSFEFRQYVQHREAALRGRMNRVVPEALKM